MHWKTSNNKLRTDIKFASVVELTKFMQTLALEIDRVNHHPDFTIQHTTMTIELFTYDENQLTQKDYQLAKYIEESYLLFIA